MTASAHQRTVLYMTERIASTEFRKRYTQLDGPHEVTALGRVIGTWLPAIAPVGSSASTRSGAGAEPPTLAPASEAPVADGDTRLPKAATPAGSTGDHPPAVGGEDRPASPPAAEGRKARDAAYAKLRAVQK